jgi:hypothetical protein
LVQPATTVRAASAPRAGIAIRRRSSVMFGVVRPVRRSCGLVSGLDELADHTFGHLSHNCHGERSGQNAARHNPRARPWPGVSRGGRPQSGWAGCLPG